MPPAVGAERPWRFYRLGYGPGYWSSAGALVLCPGFLLSRCSRIAAELTHDPDEDQARATVAAFAAFSTFVATTATATAASSGISCR